MSTPLGPTTIRTGEAPEIQAFLDERIGEYNARVMGSEGLAFSSALRDPSGEIRGGISGYTWAGCCYIQYLWIHEAERKRGLGTALMASAEAHAKAKGCQWVFVATHSFQAPAFYRRLGYEVHAVVPDHPPGHASMVLAKRLRG